MQTLNVEVLLPLVHMMRMPPLRSLHQEMSRVLHEGMKWRNAEKYDGRVEHSEVEVVTLFTMPSYGTRRTLRLERIMNSRNKTAGVFIGSNFLKTKCTVSVVCLMKSVGEHIPLPRR